MTSELFLGEIQLEGNSQMIVGAKAIMLNYLLVGNDKSVLEFELEILDKTNGGYDSDIVEIRATAERSIEDEILRVSEADTKWYALAIVIIITVLGFEMGKLNKVENRCLLCLAVAGEILLCLSFSFGMKGWLGLPAVTLDGLLPIVVAGISVDDMIVIEDFFVKAEGKPQRMAEALGAAGTAIMLTSVTTIGAFCVAGAADIPGIAAFGIAGALAFTWDFVLNVTLFPALLVLDERRIEAKRNCLFPCKIHADFLKESESDALHALQSIGTPKNSKTLQKLTSTSKSRRTSRMEVSLSKQSSREISSKAQRRTSHAQVLEKCQAVTSFSRASFVDLRALKTKEHEGKLEVYLEILARYLQKPVVKFFVLLISFGVALVARANSSLIGVGVEQESVLPLDSYITDQILTIQKFWGDGMTRYIDHVFVEFDYSDETEINKMEQYFTWIEQQDYTLGEVGGIGGGWYQSYRTYLQALGKNPYGDSITFYGNLPTFLNGPGASFKTDVICLQVGDQPCGKVALSKFRVANRSETKSATLYNMHKGMKDKLLEFGINDDLSKNHPSFPYNNILLAPNADMVMSEQMWATIIPALIVIGITMCVLADVLTAVIIVLVVILVDFDLFGMMILWYVKFSTGAFISFVITCGLCVDYCVHIGHAFHPDRHAENKAQNQTPNDLLHEAVTSMGIPVLKGGFTTFLGICVLSLCKSYIFGVFFKFLFSVVVLGMFHGLVVVPVIFSVVLSFANWVNDIFEGKGFGIENKLETFSGALVAHCEEDREKKKGEREEGEDEEGQQLAKEETEYTL